MLNSQRVCTGRWSKTRPLKQRVAAILADVQQRGDAAVLEYTARFDGLNAPPIWRRWS
jgi:histidinol dehydrogenase